MPDSPLPAPPASEADLLLWLRLIRSRRVGPGTFRRLMAEHGGARAALDALPEVARKAGVRDYTPCTAEVAQAEIKAGQALGARLLCLGSDAYPPLLARLPDAPPCLWVMGDAGLLRRDSVALVGARNASSLGTRMARALARDLGAAGQAVVSGLARGIDAAAHQAALESGTVAVMAGGIGQVYPRQNDGLARDIGKAGALISEMPPRLAPQARHFPRRNRLIAGLSRAVVVVEGAAKSGSLITAREAADLGREVLAVPGHPMDARAAGCNMLIRDGATLVRSGRDVMAALDLPAEAPAMAPADPETPPSAPPPRAGRAEALALGRRILSLLGPAPVPEDQLIRDLGRPAQEVSGQLVALELEGKLQRHAGGRLSRRP